MKAPYTIFGKTKLIPVKVWFKGQYIESDEWDTDLWIERAEDYYALNSLNDKRVRVIERDIWLTHK